MFRLILSLCTLLAMSTNGFAEQSVIILLGAPGSGKGTQADVIREKFNIPHISTGDLIRQYLKEAPADDAKANEVREIVNSGRFASDEMIIGILQKRMEKPDAKKGVILDGFPRTVNQAKELDRLLTTDATIKVIHIDVPDDIIIKRLEGRLSCPECNMIYNRFFSPPLKENICDNCGTELTKRADDNLETIKKRLEVYNEQTAPLIQYYKSKGLLQTVKSGEQPPEEISKKVIELIQNGS